MKKVTIVLAALCANAMADYCLTSACGLNEMETSVCVDPNNMRTVAANNCATPMCPSVALYKNEHDITMYKAIKGNGCIEQGIAWADAGDANQFENKALNNASCVAACPPCA